MEKGFQASVVAIVLLVAIVESRRMTLMNSRTDFHAGLTRQQAQKRQDSDSTQNNQTETSQDRAALSPIGDQEVLDTQDEKHATKLNGSSVEPIAIESSLSFRSVKPRGLMDFHAPDPIGLSAYHQAFPIPFDKGNLGSWDFDRWPSHKGDFASPAGLHDGYIDFRPPRGFDYSKDIRGSRKIPSPDISLFPSMVPREPYVENVKLSGPLSAIGHSNKFFEKDARHPGIDYYGQQRAVEKTPRFPPVVYGMTEAVPRRNRNPERPETVFRNPGVKHVIITNYQPPVVAGVKHPSTGIKENDGNLRSSPLGSDSFNSNRGAQRELQRNFGITHKDHVMGRTSHGRSENTGLRSSTVIATRVPPIIYGRPEENFSVGGKKESQHYLGKSRVPSEHVGHQSSQSPLSSGQHKPLLLKESHTKPSYPSSRLMLTEDKIRYRPESQVRSGSPGFDNTGLTYRRWPPNGPSHFVPESAPSLEAVKQHQFESLFVPETTKTFIATKIGPGKEFVHQFIPEPEASQVSQKENSGVFYNLANFDAPSKKPLKPNKIENYGVIDRLSTPGPFDSQSEPLLNDEDDLEDEEEGEEEIKQDVVVKPLAFNPSTTNPKLFWDFRNKAWITGASSNNAERLTNDKVITKSQNETSDNFGGVANLITPPSVFMSTPTVPPTYDISSTKTVATESPATHTNMKVINEEFHDGTSSLSNVHVPQVQVSADFKGNFEKQKMKEQISDGGYEVDSEVGKTIFPVNPTKDESSASSGDEIDNFTTDEFYDDSTIEVDPDSESWSDQKGNDDAAVDVADTKQSEKFKTADMKAELGRMTATTVPQGTSYTAALRLGDKVFGARKFPNKIHSQSSHFKTMFREAKEQRMKESAIHSTTSTPRYLLELTTTSSATFHRTSVGPVNSTDIPEIQTPSMKYKYEENFPSAKKDTRRDESEIIDDSYSYEEGESGVNGTVKGHYAVIDGELKTPDTVSEDEYLQDENSEEYHASVFREDSPFYLGDTETSTADYSSVGSSISTASAGYEHDTNGYFIQSFSTASTPIMTLKKEEMEAEGESHSFTDTRLLSSQRDVFRSFHPTESTTTEDTIYYDNHQNTADKDSAGSNNGTTELPINESPHLGQTDKSISSLDTSNTKSLGAASENSRSENGWKNSSSDAKEKEATPDPETVMVDSLKTMRLEMEKVMTKGIRHVMPMLMSLGSDVHLSSDCTFALFRWIRGIRMLEQWAVKMADASSKIPEGVLYGTFSTFGSYDECVAIKIPGGNPDRPVKGQYCSVNIRPLLPQNHRHFTIRDAFKNYPKMKKVFQEMNMDEESMAYYYILKHRIGLCIPSACSLEDVVNVTAMMATKLKMNITADRCETSDPKGLTPGQLFTIVGISLMACVVGLCTLVDVTFRLLARGRRAEGAEEIVRERSAGRQFCRAFSAYRNSRLILATSIPTNHISAIHGVKFLSLTWVMLGHVYYCKDYLSLAGLIKIRNLGSNLAFQVVLNSAFAADTFFFISGLLVVYTTLRRLEKRNASFTLVSFYIRRYCRLTPAFLMASGLILLGPLAGSGPIWNETLDPFVSGCQNYWWTNILYFSNFVRTTDTCVPHGWYVSCDLQFYLISPVILLALHRRPKMGIAFLISGIVLSMLTVGILTYLLDLPPVSLFSLPDPKDIHEFLDMVGYKPYTHYASYCVGMGTGYLLVTKQKLNMKKIHQMLGWCLATIGCCLVVYGTWEWNSGTLPAWPVAVGYASSCRTMWSVGIAWLIIVCAYGYGGIVNRILSWGGFVPLSRLTFIAYLIHPLLMYLYASYVRSPLYFSQYVVVYLYFGHLCLTFGLSFFLSLAFEMPFISMEKTISRNLDRQRRRRRGSFSERPENFQHPEHPEIKDAVVLTRRRNERIYF